MDEERRRVRKDCQVLEKGEKVGACPGHPELRESQPAKLLASGARLQAPCRGRCSSATYLGPNTTRQNAGPGTPMRVR